jgi:ribonuclease HII
VEALKSCYQPGLTEAGVDEAGRGALAGPVVAAAVILPADFSDPLIRDSKLLTSRQRNEARKRILAEAVCWGLGMCSVQQIDRENILQAAFSAMHEAIEALGIEADLLLIDGNRFRPHRLAHVCVVKGDRQYASIAAASILAKTYRDELMEELDPVYPAYGWAQNKGYPTRAHREALQRVGLSPWHRRSFACIPAPGLFGTRQEKG